MKKAPKILNELISDFKLSKEILASKMGVSTVTISRWQKNITNPTYAELKLLNQIYRGHQNVSK